jgi:hypothetical protein
MCGKMRLDVRGATLMLKSFVMSLLANLFATTLHLKAPYPGPTPPWFYTRPTCYDDTPSLFLTTLAAQCSHKSASHVSDKLAFISAKFAASISATGMSYKSINLAFLTNPPTLFPTNWSPPFLTNSPSQLLMMLLFPTNLMTLFLTYLPTRFLANPPTLFLTKWLHQFMMNLLSQFLTNLMMLFPTNLVTSFLTNLVVAISDEFVTRVSDESVDYVSDEFGVCRSDEFADVISDECIGPASEKMLPRPISE